jgi:hypothetical protein
MNALQRFVEAPTLPLPGGRCRLARTPEEVRYGRALEANAHARKALGVANCALNDARRALYAAVAEHGPDGVEALWARQAWTEARAESKARAADVDATEDELGAALDAWARALRAAP